MNISGYGEFITRTEKYEIFWKLEDNDESFFKHFRKVTVVVGRIRKWLQSWNWKQEKNFENNRHK